MLTTLKSKYMDIAIRKNWFGQLVGGVQGGPLQPMDYCLLICLSARKTRKPPGRTFFVHVACGRGLVLL